MPFVDFSKLYTRAVSKTGNNRAEPKLERFWIKPNVSGCSIFSNRSNLFRLARFFQAARMFQVTRMFRATRIYFR